MANPVGSEVSHKPLRLHLARLEHQGIFAKANSTCAPKTPPKPQKGINTIFNHFCNKLARYFTGKIVLTIVLIRTKRKLESKRRVTQKTDFLSPFLSI